MLKSPIRQIKSEKISSQLQGFLVSADGSDSEHEGKAQRFSPNSLRHGNAYRGALTGIPLRQLAPSMGHDVRTNMKH